MSLVAGTRLGPYEVLAPIGTGGMGEVYRARDTKLKRDVALKVLPEAFARDPGRMLRFQREAEVLASLNHPNIAHIYGVEERALVMELVEGESPKGPLPFEDAWKIALQIADALEYAHERGVIHRDLKPANVKVTPDGVVKLLDFGLAKAFSETPDSGSADPENSPTITLGATVAGTVLGTAAYMSPEQAKGKKVDKRADIWSWGVVLYELLTGERLFKGEDATDTLAQVLAKTPDLEKAPPQVRKLLRRCLEKDPKGRLRDIGDVLYLLEETVPLQSGPGRVSRLGIGGWLVAAVLALIAATTWFTRTPAAAPERAYRLSILPPEGTSFDFAAASGTHALSPDGRTLAFVAQSNGATQIWVRPLDGTVARRLDGTDQAYGVSWSPDARYLAFPTPGKLRRIEVATGNVRDLCAASDVRGITWNQQDILVFSQINSALWRVSAEGGVPEIAAIRDYARGEEQLLWPQFLPDGRHFLYQIRGKPAVSGTYVGSLDSKPDAQPRIHVRAGIQNSLYSPGLSDNDGFLLFLRGRTLLAQRFNDRGFRLEGEPFAIAEDVGGRTDYAAFAISANGTFAYSSEEAGRYRVELVGRNGTTLRMIGDPDRDISITLSHNEKQLALWRFGASEGTYDVWMMDVARGVPSRFTTDPASDMYPVWSPDDKEIIFSSSRRGPYNLFRMRATGGPAKLIQAADSGQFARDWSPDGKLLVYEDRASSVSTFHLLALPLQGGETFQLTNTEFDERHPAVSPSGRWLAYLSNPSGTYDVYVQAFPRAGKVWRATNGGGFAPRWRADEKELFYSTPNNTLVAMPVQTQSTEFIPGTPKPLFPLKSAAFAFISTFWWPLHDGQSFLVLRPAEPAQGKPITIVTNWQALSR
jgi:Tol biopolymer transport system component